MRRLRLWVLPLIVLGLLATGCVNVPTSGPVIPGGAPGPQEPNNVEIAPEPPAPGAQPTTIVEGFLHAMASFGGGSDVAREFLTDEARAEWRAENGVRVYADGYPIIESGGSVRLRAPGVGRVAADGSYQPVSELVDIDFELEQVDGQWRISNPPDGLLIPEYLFKRFYQRLNLYFFDPSYETLVPDPIYLPTSNQTATTVIRRLMAGPTEWLSPVVVSVLPQGTELNVAAPVDASGVVEISLSEPIGRLDDNARSRLAAQLVWTVRQLSPGISGVRILHNGAAYAIPEQDDDGIVPISAYDAFDPSPHRMRPDLFAADQTGIGRIIERDGEISLEPVLGPAGVAGPVGSMGVDVLGDRVAWVSPDRSSVTVAPLAEGEARMLLQDKYALSRPQFTRFAELWVLAGTGDDQELLVVTEEGGEAGVEFGDIGELRTFRVSPDGLRIAVVAENDDGSDQLLLGRIARTDRIIAEKWRSIPAPSSQPITRIADIGWTSPTSLSVLLADGEGPDLPAKPYTVDQAGATWQLVGQPDNWNAVELATFASSEESRVVMLSSDGTAWRFEDDFRWPRLLEGLTSIAFPG